MPGLDHAGQLRDLRRAVGGAATVRVSDCLGTCEQANVIVVQPSALGRRDGGRPTWLGLVNEPDTIAEIARWVRRGGPGVTDPPAALDLHDFRPPRRVRRDLDD